MFDPSLLSYSQAKAAATSSINNPEFREFMVEALDMAYGDRDFGQLRHALNLHSYPVPMEEFLFGQRYLVRPRDELYPVVVEELVKINEGHGRVVNRLTEVVATGGIGSAKTTTALYTQAYQLYVLSCYKNPHAMFQMDSSSEILFIFQSLNATLSKDVDYKRFKAICEQSYYFTTVFPFNKLIVSSLQFPNRIECKPIGSDSGALGQNVLSGIIDEVNFMAVVDDSKKNSNRGVYDQARTIYDGISRRIKTRFVNNGGMPGILCLVSSKNYPGEFTDVKLKEAAGDPTIYVYDKRVWDIKPKGTFTGEQFSVFVGDETRKARIIEDDTEVSVEDRHLVINAPVEYKRQFQLDMTGSLRDIAGVGTLARYPYFQDAQSVSASFQKRVSVLSKEEHDFQDSLPLQMYPLRFKDPGIPRWVHVDLAITGDAAGVACGYVPGFVSSRAGTDELMPRIAFDFILRVLPPPGGEIKFYKIRELLYTLREMGLPIRWVSFDSFQSVDSVQILRQQGFATGYISVDTSTMPYDLAKAAMYEGRLEAPPHRAANREFLSLERVAKKNKIDHPVNGSKDCSDGMAGVVQGLTTRREVWNFHNVSPTSIPLAIRTAEAAQKQGPKHERPDNV